MKNMSKKMWRKYRWSIVYYEIKKIIYCLFLERKTLKAWKEIEKNKEEYIARRQHILEGRKINDQEMMKWFN